VNAYRVYDADGEHRYTVFSEAEAKALIAQHAGWSYSAVSIKDPRW
jgi:hypothetical protein